MVVARIGYIPAYYITAISPAYIKSRNARIAGATLFASLAI